ncbi:nuclear transport factor 2 family protein [Polaribacter sp.]|uniref:nuclear transport factor 2 family protein n=1 Tax=Polaribacter sp. TaxID=1920175 RepID=UPI003F6B9AC8
MLKRSLVVCFLLLGFITKAQSNTNTIEEISKTIRNYYEGYIERDINKLNTAFDTEYGTMKVPILKNDEIVGYQNHYFKALMPKWGNRAKLSTKVLQNCALEILNIDVVDSKIASAKMSMKVDTITYIDILSMHKIDNLWKITNKIYTIKK